MCNRASSRTPLSLHGTSSLFVTREEWTRVGCATLLLQDLISDVASFDNGDRDRIVAGFVVVIEGNGLDGDDY